MFTKLEKPVIKKYNTRCSTQCIQNWTKYNQKPPIGYYCNCIIKYFNKET